MTRRATPAALLVALTMSLGGFSPSAATGATTLQGSVEQLYASLTDEQRKKATLPINAPERTREVFTGGERAGIQIKTLNEDQQKQAMALLTAFTSDYGKKKAIEIADQASNTDDPTTGFGRYFLCFFGDVKPGGTYAWRIAEHHLTLVHLEVERGTPKSFGPILLGANPPVLFDEEEDKMIALYSAMSPAEREKAQQQGKGISTDAFKGRGIKLADLSPSAQAAAKAVYDHRLSFFADTIREQIQKTVASQGGLNSMQVAFYGKPTKKCRDGGRWDFKLAGLSFLCDYEGSRADIHLSMKGELLELNP